MKSFIFNYYKLLPVRETLSAVQASRQGSFVYFKVLFHQLFLLCYYPLIVLIFIFNLICLPLSIFFIAYRFLSINERLNEIKDGNFLFCKCDLCMDSYARVITEVRAQPLKAKSAYLLLFSDIGERQKLATRIVSENHTKAVVKELKLGKLAI